MKNDCWLQALLNERKYAVTSLRWHLQVDDERDPLQKAVSDTLTRVVQSIPRFRRLCVYLLEAIWYGRYGAEVVWKWDYRPMPRLGDPTKNELTKVLAVASHQPINGDKIGHHWDGTPYVLVNPAFDSRIKGAEIHPTTAGADGLYLRGHWRNHFVIHTHEAIDADYFDPMGGDGVHGVGIRSVLYWLDWIRKEWLGNVADWCERTGLGIRLWYFQAGNPTSEAAVKKAAREATDRTNIFIPRYGAQSGAGAEGVEYVDTSGTGADLLLKLQKHVEEMEERYIVGQSMSGGADREDGLGGTGRAKLAQNTKNQIIAYDAANLGETLTTDLVKVIQEWTYRDIREARDVNARLVFNVDEEEPEKLLGAIKTFVLDLGGTVRADGVRSAVGKGFEKPQEGDEVISLETINAQKPQQPAMPGMPGEPGAGVPAGTPAGGEEDLPPGTGDVQDVEGPGGSEEPENPRSSGLDDDAVNQKIDELLARMEKVEEADRGAAPASAPTGTPDVERYQKVRDPDEVYRETRAIVEAMLS